MCSANLPQHALDMKLSSQTWAGSVVLHTQVHLRHGTVNCAEMYVPRGTVEESAELLHKANPFSSSA